MVTQIPYKSCILLICGLPSSGKTLLANNLLRHSQLNPILLNNNKSDGNVVFYKISIDDLMSINEQSIAVQINGFWKQFRNNLLIASKVFIRNHLLKHKNEDNYSNEMDSKVSSIYESIKRLNINNLNEKSGHHFVLIIDDNFYYKSMRYEWFQIAKQLKMGFALIMINCSLDLAINRNQTRNDDKCLANSVIIKMNDRFQFPQMNGFEKRTFNVWTHCFDFEMNSDLIEFIIDAIRNPVVEEQNTTNEVNGEESQLSAESNVVHRVDCILRQIIRQKMINSFNKTQIAKTLSEAKKSVLNDLKQSTLILPKDLNNQIMRNQTNIENFNNKEIKLFFSNLLDNKINTNQY